MKYLTILNLILLLATFIYFHQIDLAQREKLHDLDNVQKAIIDEVTRINRHFMVK